MDEQTRRIVRSLAEMAKADGEISPEERALLLKVLIEAGAASVDIGDLDALLDSLGDEPDGGSLEGVDEDKRANVMRALLIMSFMDDKLSFGEFTQIEKHAQELNIGPAQMEMLRSEAVEAAKAIKAEA